MRVASVADGSRDGALVVVDRTGRRFARASGVASTLQGALDDWAHAAPALRASADALERGEVAAEPVERATFLAPLPRAYEWIDGSAYLHHVRLVRRARGAALPDDLETVPLMYQGGSGVLSGATDPLLAFDGSGPDFEGEIAVVVGDVARGTTAERAVEHVRLLMLANDVTYRDWIPAELARGFGFLISKPATAFAPFAATPDELGPAFRAGRAHLRLVCTHHGADVGDLDTGGEMHFSFGDLIAHAAKTRSLVSGTIVGSGTVSNSDASRGVACLAERRAREALAFGAPRTPYLRPGDSVRLEAFSADGRSIFGAIEQRVVPA
jgi:fumarylacetoacetate (FAA) hydrolase